MTTEQGQLCLAGRQVQHANNPGYSQKVQGAIDAVQQRPAGCDQSELLSDVPEGIEEYLKGFQSLDSFKPFAEEGWSIKIADLGKVCALQPVVFWDHAKERTETANQDDMLSIAKVTLPIPNTEPLPVQFDGRNTWMITSRNPNLRVVGHFSQPVGIGVTGCGFLVSITPSFVQVVLHRARYILRDGYHRSLGLLARGITKVPVLYREFSQYEDLALGPGMLPGQSYLGDRPPLIEDYLNDEVATEVFLPASQKMIVVQGTEMNPLG